jgi:hypothetical protein
MKQRYDCDACPAKRLGAGRWGYFFLHAQIRSPHSLYQPGLTPERAENTRWRDSHNIYSTPGCETASIQSP